MKIVDINGRTRDCTKAYHNPSWPGYITVEFESRNRKGYKHTEWMPIADFAAKNPDLKDLYEGVVTSVEPKEFAGVVTASGPDSIVDTTQSWVKNLYAGFFVWISRGPGEGQTRTILSNTSTELKLDKAWGIRPTEDSQYAVVRKLGDTSVQGNVLPLAELKKLEEIARKMDEELGREPAPRQYTKDNKSSSK